jgi:spore germination protein YaaH
MMIMAYDLHKARGEPGPNFPLRGRETYGYDLESLVSDMSGVPPEKLTVIYGMYGYDWTVDEKKRPFRQAKSVTLAQVKKNYIDQCAAINCVTTRDKSAAENEIDFVDKQAQYHVIWFEDMESSKQKTVFLNQKGIGSIAFWAYGYF